MLFNGKPIPKHVFNPVQLIYQHPEKALDPFWKLEKSIHEAGEITAEQRKELNISDQWLSKYPHELSGGEMQRFCIARIMQPSTKFLIADEMTTMLDSITQAKIWETTIRYTRENNIGVIVVSHDESLLARICDRVVEL